MRNWIQPLSRWLPALTVMLVIFVFSAQPSSRLPTFDWADGIIKKGGHMIGYALLALCYWRGLQFQEGKRWLAWLLVILYALSDEYHQSFVAGRFPSIWDILIFDNLGAVVSLWLLALYRKQKRPDAVHPIVGQTSR